VQIQPHRPHILSHAALLLLLLALFAQLQLSHPQLSLTADEPVYMAQGYAWWSGADFRLQYSVAQPPLPGLLAGIGLQMLPGPDIKTLPGWQENDLARVSRAFVAAYGPALPQATFLARFPAVLITLLGAAFVYRWARRHAHPAAGLLALALYAFDPNLLAHGPLAATDILLAVWSFIALYAAWEWNTGRSRWAPLVGLTLGLALGSKSSGFFPLALVGLLIGLQSLTVRRPDLPHAILRAAGKFLFSALLAFIVLWALYRFEIGSFPGLPFPIPFPSHWKIWSALTSHMVGGHTAFLLGEISQNGWWYYYPLTFLLKTPPAVLILLIWAAARGLRSGPATAWNARALVLFPLLYSLAAMLSTIAIGYRYLLVILPFLYILIGSLWPADPRRLPRRLLLAAVTLTALGTLLSFPDYLAYFTPLIGGPAQGQRYLVDSNLDWGQSWIELRQYLTRRPDLNDRPLYLSYYTYTDPALYGLKYTPLAPAPEAAPVLDHPFNPDPGLYALSATTLQGVMVADTETYDWFRHQIPLARPGWSIFLYEVTSPVTSPTWLAQCTHPVIPLSPEAAASGLGRSNLRQIQFDCTAGWIYPSGTGWYALYRDTARSTDAFIAARLQSARLTYEQSRPGALPPFTLYQQDEHPQLPQSPVNFGALTFLGYTHVPGTALELESWWRVEQLPDRPLSLMFHLVGPDNNPQVADGLSVPYNLWQPGDILVQRHPFQPAGNQPNAQYTPQIGVYWLDTVERWKAADGSDILILPPLTPAQP